MKRRISTGAGRPAYHVGVAQRAVAISHWLPMLHANEPNKGAVRVFEGEDDAATGVQALKNALKRSDAALAGQVEVFAAQVEDTDVAEWCDTFDTETAPFEPGDWLTVVEPK